MTIDSEQLLSQKYNNYDYAPGIATYGIDGKTGETGYDGNNIYFTDYDITGSLGDNINTLQKLLSKIQNNLLPISSINISVNREYKEGDLFFDRNGVIYKLINKDIKSSQMSNYLIYFTIVGKINVTDDQEFFEFAPNSNRLILNAKYNGYDIISGMSTEDALQYIDTDSAVNVISNNINENDNIEMVRLQSIDDVDIEDGKLEVLYKTTENIYHINSNKPIVINGDLKIENTNNTENEYDDYSTVLTSNDTISYFKYICDKLRYMINYDSEQNQYNLVIYTKESDLNKQKELLEYICNKNETVFGKIYTANNEQVLLSLGDLTYPQNIESLKYYNIKPIYNNLNMSYQWYGEYIYLYEKYYEGGTYSYESINWIPYDWFLINISDSENGYGKDISIKINKSVAPIPFHYLMYVLLSEMHVNIQHMKLTKTYEIINSYDEGIEGYSKQEIETYLPLSQIYYNNDEQDNMFTFNAQVSNNIRMCIEPMSKYLIGSGEPIYDITEIVPHNIFEKYKTPLMIDIDVPNELQNEKCTLYFRIEFNNDQNDPILYIKNIQIRKEDYMLNDYSVNDNWCLISKIPDSVDSVMKFSLLHNTEVFLNYEE